MPWARRVEAVIKGYMLLGSDDTDCRLRRTLQQFRGSICAASPVSGPRFLRTCQKALFLQLETDGARRRPYERPNAEDPSVERERILCCTGVTVHVQ
jgi:hypothetical protein